MAKPKTKIYLGEFLFGLKNPSIQRIANGILEEDLDLKLKDVQCKGLEFVNCDFLSSVTLSNVILPYGIKFTNCTISEFCLIDNCQMAEYDTNFNSDGYSIKFQNTKIGNSLTINKNSLNRAIGIIDEAEINGLQIFENTLQFDSLDINRSTIKGKCDIEKNVIPVTLGFRESIIDAVVRLTGNSISEHVFQKNTFKKELKLWGGSTKGIIFNDGEYHSDVSITAVQASGMLTIMRGDFKSSFFVEYTDTIMEVSGGCEDIYIAGANFERGLYLLGSDNLFKPYSINKVNVIFSETLKGEISFRNFTFKDVLLLAGNNSNSHFKVINSNICKLKFSEFTNSSQVQFFDVKAVIESESLLEIKHSNLGQTEFYNFNFSAFQKIVIWNSVLSDIITSNVKWFKRMQLDPVINSASVITELWSNNREVFRQLKYAMSKQGNRIQELTFKSYEMYAYKMQLNSQTYTKENTGDKVILCLSQTNNYGSDWIKPLIYILSFNLFFYCCIVVTISDEISYIPSCNSDDWKLTFNEFGKYSYAIPKMLSPLTPFDKIFILDSKEPNSFITNLWDFCNRIVLSYFIFQLISAFRKFLK